MERNAMGRYNSDNTHVLATKMQAGDNRRMLLLHICESGRHEFVIGSYFNEVRDPFNERWDYSWYWGHYFPEVMPAIEYWQQVLKNER